MMFSNTWNCLVSHKDTTLQEFGSRHSSWVWVVGSDRLALELLAADVHCTTGWLLRKLLSEYEEHWEKYLICILFWLAGDWTAVQCNALHKPKEKISLNRAVRAKNGATRTKKDTNRNGHIHTRKSPQLSIKLQIASLFGKVTTRRVLDYFS